MGRVNWAVLISGRGSNLAALMDLGDEIGLKLVMSSDPRASGIARARREGIPVEITPFIEGTKKIAWNELDQRLRRSGVTHIFLAGFMKIVPASFINSWRGQILNLHPSLLPAYPGLDSIARAYSDEAPMGASVHEVIEDVDAGRILKMRETQNARRAQGVSMEEAEFRVHLDEQRLVRETIVHFPETYRTEGP